MKCITFFPFLFYSRNTNHILIVVGRGYIGRRLRWFCGKNAGQYVDHFKCPLKCFFFGHFVGAIYARIFWAITTVHNNHIQYWGFSSLTTFLLAGRMSTTVSICLVLSLRLVHSCDRFLCTIIANAEVS